MDISHSPKVRQAIKFADEKVQRFYDKTTTQHLSLEVSYSKTITSGEYKIFANAHYLKDYKITSESIINLSTSEYTYDDFVVVLKTLFDKWHFPIFVTYMADVRVSERLLKRLKETFHDAVKSGEVYNL